MNPATFLGKFICGLCAITGIFILTLPIPIVVTRWVHTGRPHSLLSIAITPLWLSFASCYKNTLWRNEISMKKRMLSSYTAREHKLAEKRNLFPDLAGAGGFYIPKTKQEEEDTEEEQTEMSVVLTPSVTEEKFTVAGALQSRLSTETCFLAEGTVQERRCLAQHTDV